MENQDVPYNRDEYDSSKWRNGSSKIMAIYATNVELAAIASSYLMADPEEGIRLATQLRHRVEEGIGKVPGNSEHEWPLGYT